MPLSQHMPELRALEALTAVVEAGSFHAAADRLGVTQQAVSARIANLEAITGVPLLTRSSHGSRPTDAGTVAVEWSSRLLELAHQVDTALATLRSEAHTRIRVSASLTVAEQLLPGWLVSLQAEATRAGRPVVDVVLTATNSDHVIEQVRSGQADLGFIEGPTAPRGLRSRVVAHDNLVLVVPDTHPWARRTRPVSAQMLAATPLITREAGSGTRDFLARALTGVLGPRRRAGRPSHAAVLLSRRTLRRHRRCRTSRTQPPRRRR